jgi:TolA-binding protein
METDMFQTPANQQTALCSNSLIKFGRKSTCYFKERMMKVNFLKRTMMMSVIGVVSLVGTSAIANAQQGRGRQRPVDQTITQPQRQRQIETQRQQQWPQRQAEERKRTQEQQWRLEQQRQQQIALQRQQQQLAIQRQRLEQQRLERLRQEQMRRNNTRYNNNRSVYTNPGARPYRVYRNGGYYQTDQNGVTALRQAVNYGYQEGVRAGQADRAYGNGFNYQDSAAYRNGNYGYSYVDSNEYSYYFREGFRRGYEDGYNSRSQYGSNSNGSVNILTAILQQLLNFESY